MLLYWGYRHIIVYLMKEDLIENILDFDFNKKGCLWTISKAFSGQSSAKPRKSSRHGCIMLKVILVKSQQDLTNQTVIKMFKQSKKSNNRRYIRKNWCVTLQKKQKQTKASELYLKKLLKIVNFLACNNLHGKIYPEMVVFWKSMDL